MRNVQSFLAPCFCHRFFLFAFFLLLTLMTSHSSHTNLLRYLLSQAAGLISLFLQMTMLFAHHVSPIRPQKQISLTYHGLQSQTLQSSFSCDIVIIGCSYGMRPKIASHDTKVCLPKHYPVEYFGIRIRIQCLANLQKLMMRKLVC